MAHPLDDHLNDYLRDAHSIEVQALQQLKKAPDLAEEPGFSAALAEHHRETEAQERKVRELLEARGTSPSKVKDLVMKAGGEGFVLFARSQTDTSGKLASHALAYEALEWASYELLARTADRADAPRVAAVARSIQAEEGAMMERIEGLLERTALSSLDEAVTDDVAEHLRRYLADAHALEAQSIQLLESGIEMVDGRLEQVFRDHLGESRSQQETLERRLDELGSDRSFLKDVALRIGALNWGMFFGGQPDTPGKLAAFAYAFEHLEIAGYVQLATVAERAGDPATARAARDILAAERRAAALVRETLGEALDASLAAVTAS